MPADKNKYFTGRFKNCGRCKKHDFCRKRKQDLTAFRCKEYTPDLEQVLAKIKVNEAIRIRNEFNRKVTT